MAFGDVDNLIGSGGATAGMIAKLTACRHAIEGGAREVFIADGRDVAALSVLVRHGSKAGAGKATRIFNGESITRRHLTQLATPKRSGGVGRAEGRHI
jgi:glutamate 5-kinase